MWRVELASATKRLQVKASFNRLINTHQSVLRCSDRSDRGGKARLIFAVTPTRRQTASDTGRRSLNNLFRINMLCNSSRFKGRSIHKLALPLFFLLVAYKTNTAGDVTRNATAKITKPPR